MQYEICFLDRGGRLSCQMTAQFFDQNHAARFARHAMDTAAARGKLHSAEIHGDGQRLAVMASPFAQTRSLRPARMSLWPRAQVPALA